MLRYQECIPCEQLVMQLCDVKQAYTQFGGETVPDPLEASEPPTVREGFNGGSQRAAPFMECVCILIGKRPFGVSILYVGWDRHFGYQLYQSDPSGNYGGWKATCIGNNHQVMLYL